MALQCAASPSGFVYSKLSSTLSPPFTIASWFYLPALGQNVMFGCLADDAGFFTYTLLYHSFENNAMSCASLNGGAGNVLGMSGHTLNAWNFAAMTVDANHTNQLLYVNGASITGGNTIATFKRQRKLVFGMRI
jgi:hypothetical protein